MTIQVNFLLHGDLPESGTMSSCLVQAPVSLDTIRQVFPFEGEFHFRVKRYDIIPDHKFVWVDLTRDAEAINATNGIIDIQALVVSLPPEDDGEKADDYLAEVQHILKEAILDDDNRPDRQAIKVEKLDAGVDPITLATNTAMGIAKGIQNISLDSVSKNAASIWSSMKSTASHFGMQLTTPADNLNKLNSYLTTPYDDGAVKHQQLLEELWDAIFPGHPFQREGAKWKEAGWQKPNPIIDLKSSGILALRCMRYLGQTYPADTLRMVTSQKENIKSHYPFAVVGINMTLMLCEVLGIRDKRFNNKDEVARGSFELFEDKNSFYEIFCLCFLYLDTVWNQRGCVRADFGALMGEVKSHVSAVMERVPQTMDEFRSIAEEVGLTVAY